MFKVIAEHNKLQIGVPVSIRRLFTLLVTVMVLTAMSGCAQAYLDPHSAARSVARTNLANELNQLKQNFGQDVAASSTTEQAVAKVQANGSSYAYMLTSRPSDVPSGSMFTAITAITPTSDGLLIDAMLEGSGESGGGGTYQRSDIYICVKIIGAAGSAQVKVLESKCRPDLLALVMSRPNTTRYHLNNLPLVK